MRTFQKPIPVVVYQDVLCAWSYLADLRLERVRERFGVAIDWRFRPFPLRLTDALPTAKELREARGEIDRAKIEADPVAKRLTAEVWNTPRGSRSSMPPLAALEAARMQGEPQRRQLLRLMHSAALETGIDVTRNDVLFELASKVGLKMDPFAATFRSERVRKLIRHEHKLATARGVSGVPTMVVANRWMLSGLREEREYNDQLLLCMGKLLGEPERDPESHVH